MTALPPAAIPPGPPDEPDGIRISQRAAVIALLALVAGGLVGGLTYAAYLNIAQAILAGVIALATAAIWLSRWIR